MHILPSEGADDQLQRHSIFAVWRRAAEARGDSSKLDQRQLLLSFTLRRQRQLYPHKIWNCEGEKPIHFYYEGLQENFLISLIKAFKQVPLGFLPFGKMIRSAFCFVL